MIQANGINHVVLHVSDVPRAKKFYTEVLGMTVAHEGSWQVFLNCGRRQVALFAKRGDEPLTTADMKRAAACLVAGIFWTVTASTAVSLTHSRRSPAAPRQGVNSP